MKSSAIIGFLVLIIGLLGFMVMKDYLKTSSLDKVSGIVLDNDACAPVGDVTVKIGDKKTVTNDKGFFSLGIDCETQDCKALSVTVIHDDYNMRQYNFKIEDVSTLYRIERKE